MNSEVVVFRSMRCIGIRFAFVIVFSVVEERVTVSFARLCHCMMVMVMHGAKESLQEQQAEEDTEAACICCHVPISQCMCNSLAKMGAAVLCD